MSNVALALGGICCVGGIAGYIRKKSAMSAVAGCLIGVMYFYSGLLLATVGSFDQGRYIALAASAILGGSMAARYLKTLKALPLVLTVVGVGAFTFFAVAA